MTIVPFHLFYKAFIRIFYVITFDSVNFEFTLKNTLR